MILMYVSIENLNFQLMKIIEFKQYDFRINQNFFDRSFALSDFNEYFIIERFYEMTTKFLSKIMSKYSI